MVQRNGHSVIKPRQMALMTVYKNEFQNSSLPLQAMKLRDYILSELKTGEHIVTINTADYFATQGITTLYRRHREMLKEALDTLFSKETAILTIDPESKKYQLIRSRWVTHYREDGEYDESRRYPDAYIIQCNKDVTQMIQADLDCISSPREYSNRMTSKYGYPAREYFLSRGIFDEPLEVSLEELAELLDASDLLQKKDLGQFKRNVIQALVKDINEFCLDMEITDVQYRKEGGSTKYVLFTVHQIQNPIDLNIYIQDDRIDAKRLNAIHKQISFNILSQVYTEQKDIELVAKIIYAAHRALDEGNASLPAKFNMTAEELRNALNNLTMWHVAEGLQEAMSNRKQRFMEMYILRCLLDAKPETSETPGSDPQASAADSGNIPTPGAENTSRADTVPAGTPPVTASQATESVAFGPKKAEADADFDNSSYAGPSGTAAAKEVSTMGNHKMDFSAEETRQGKRQRTTKERQQKATAWAMEKIGYESLRQTYTVVNDFLTEEAADVGQEALDDLIAVIVHVMTTYVSSLSVGATSYVRMRFASDDLNNDIARMVLTKYINEVYESLRYQHNAKSRQNYILRMLWSAMDGSWTEL